MSSMVFGRLQKKKVFSLPPPFWLTCERGGTYYFSTHGCRLLNNSVFSLLTTLAVADRGAKKLIRGSCIKKKKKNGAFGLFFLIFVLISTRVFSTKKPSLHKINQCPCSGFFTCLSNKSFITIRRIYVVSDENNLF